MNYSLQTSPTRQKVEKQFLSVMFALGSNSESINLGKNNSNTDRAWVDNQSSIIGTESVDIDVKGKLGMEGSLIANIDKDGKDAGNLDIKAGSFEAKDLNNRDNNSQTGFGFSTSTGSDPKGGNDGTPKGTTSVTVTDMGSEKEGATHSTIGKGNIEVADGSDTSDINRDISKTETITKDEITGALDATVKVDNRIFTESGREDIAKDFAESADVAAKVAEDVGNLIQTGSEKAVNTVVNLFEKLTPEQRIDVVAETNVNNILKFAKDIAENTDISKIDINDINKPKNIDEAIKYIDNLSTNSFENLTKEQKETVAYIYEEYKLDAKYLDDRKETVVNVYKKVLNDQYKEIFYRFDELPLETQQKVISIFCDDFYTELGLKNKPEIGFYDGPSNSYGKTKNDYSKIELNNKNIDDVSETMDTIAHEGQHASVGQSNSIDKNTIYIKNNMDNAYIKPSDSYSKYENQPAEIDARNVGNAVKQEYDNTIKEFSIKYNRDKLLESIGNKK